MRAVGIVALAVAAWLVPSMASACSCERPLPDFWQVAREAPVVVVAEITGHIKVHPHRDSTGFEVRVVEVVKGSEERKVIRLVADGLGMCNQWPESFPIGSRHAIALMPGDPKEGVFTICRPRTMELEDAQGRATSPITAAELRKRLRASKRPR